MELISMPMGNINSHWHHTTFFNKSGWVFFVFKKWWFFLMKRKSDQIIFHARWDVNWMARRMCVIISAMASALLQGIERAGVWVVWKISIFLAYRCYYKRLFYSVISTAGLNCLGSGHYYFCNPKSLWYYSGSKKWQSRLKFGKDLMCDAFLLELKSLLVLTQRTEKWPQTTKVLKHCQGKCIKRELPLLCCLYAIDFIHISQL